MEIMAVLLSLVGQLLIGFFEVMVDSIVTLLVHFFSHKEQKQQYPIQK